MLTILLIAAIAAPGPPPDVVNRMLNRIKRDTGNSRSLHYIQERTEHYEVHGGVDRQKKRETKTVRGTGAGFLERLTTVDGKTLNNGKEKLVETAMIQLAAKYEFALVSAPAVPIDGYDCWQVAFKPRSGLRDGSDDDAILNHIQGIAYVDTRHYLIRSIHATLSNPFRRGFLGAARVYAITVDVRQMEWDERARIGIQTTTVVHVQYSVIGETSLRIEYLNTNHQWHP